MKLFEVAAKRKSPGDPGPFDIRQATSAMLKWINVDKASLNGDQPEYSWMLDDYVQNQGGAVFRSVFFDQKKKKKIKNSIRLIHEMCQNEFWGMMTNVDQSVEDLYDIYNSMEVVSKGHVVFYGNCHYFMGGDDSAIPPFKIDAVSGTGDTDFSNMTLSKTAITDHEWLPTESNNLFMNNTFSNFQGIEKIIKKCVYLNIQPLGRKEIDFPILGVMKIEGLKGVGFGKGDKNQTIAGCINRNLENGNKGIMKAQSELLDLGYDDIASL